MSQFLIFCIITSFKITAIHICCWPGNIFFHWRNAAGYWIYSWLEEDSRWITKPLYDCLPCMASIWGLIFWALEGANYNPIGLILTLCGMLALIETVVHENPIDSCERRNLP